ncbi:uncharacterized protein N7483_009977 [Penicillium malachiteum]|uniref:uncharacterized protein n=1 Tax=Penicillium malachiteum TaxID=1324776 RepID=UPI00254760CD|nr:uncharacterized protein N7483_009977 [Penicillium malachiteum]KAJ5718895.1 hypothetical protein N7483_009977 [Penicillium malachiteum]
MVDCNGTFMSTLRPNSSGSQFEPLLVKGNDDISLSVALPSRLRAYSVPNPSPISGWRIVVKDNTHIKGIKSSVGNRAFYDTYGPQQETATCIQRLVEQGAVVLGKPKMTSFGNWEEPVEYVDYQAPWNARADGYQSPGGSSSGSASAISAYDRVDIALGTDSKDLDLFHNHAGEKADIFKLGEVSPAERFSVDALDSALVWVQSLKQELNLITLRLEPWDISVEDAWRDQPPDEAGGLPLADFINPATASLACDVYHNSSDFREQHRKKFKREPFTTFPNRRLWEVGKTISEEERDSGFKDIEAYARWFNEIILKESRANALMILPLESMCPRYRDEAPSFERPPQQGINTLALAPVLKAPALAVPIAEISYKSRISQITERLPFAVCIVSPPGTDLVLLDCVRDVLIASGRPTVVKTGQSMI